MIPCGGLRRVLAADRLLLAGDAAGFADPFYGEGLAYAIRSGQIAASVAVESVKDDDFSRQRLSAFELMCKDEFSDNLWYSLQLTRLMCWKPGVFLRLMSSDPEVLRKYLSVPRGELSYFSFMAWLLPRVPWFLIKSLFRGNNAKSRITGSVTCESDVEFGVKKRPTRLLNDPVGHR